MALVPDSPADRLGRLLAALADELRPLVAELLDPAALNETAQLPAAERDVDRWLTPSEAAARVGVHRRTIYRALAAGTLDGGQLVAGSGACRWRIRTSEVDRWAGARADRFTPPARQPAAPRPSARPANSPDSYRARLKEHKP